MTTVATKAKPKVPGTGRGIQIVEIDGKTTAFIARNGFKFLNAVLKSAKLPSNWEGIEEYKDMPNVYEVGPEIPTMAYPNVESAGSNANIVKATLAQKNVIEILREGDAGKGAVIRLLVDGYKVKVPKSQTKATDQVKRPVGRPKNSTSKTTTKKVAKTSTTKKSMLNGFDMKTLERGMLLLEHIAAVKKQFPDVYATFIEGHLPKKAA